MKKVLSLILASVLCIGLCACGVKKEPTALEKAQADAKAAQEAYEAISDAADEAEERLDQAQDLVDKILGG